MLPAADTLGLAVRLEALRGSPADRFYLRHRLVKLDKHDVEARYERIVNA